MIKKILLIALLIISFSSIAQKAQRIGFIDMEYILENVPEYNEAQGKINAKAITWQNNIEKLQKEIDDLNTELNSEKALLTDELIIEKEEDIDIKRLDLKKLQAAYFGTNGDLFFLRKQLVKPIQDLVYNAVQDIAKKRKYDFVFDKSSDLIMLFTNKKFDISDLVITSITRIKKIDAVKEKQQQKNAPVVKVNEELQKKLTDREAKKLELQQRVEAKRAEQLKKREELKSASVAKRLEKTNTSETSTDTEENSVSKDAISKLSEKEAKKLELQERIKVKRAEQLKKREELKAAIEAKRQKRIQDIEAAKKAKEENTKTNN